ncbi:MAG: hypothetical protein DSY43_06235 [Gammaproteobacteria bacterium]|nr:MAG: hypothetical protein DSY43_06235 [Gammaproteobacteria bacterium]
MSFVIHGKIDGKNASMIVDTGCTRTLVHERFVTGEGITRGKVTVLTASGERVIVPLVHVEIESKKGTFKELVGVMAKLPVDCLLGCSSYGQTLSQDDLIQHWEHIIKIADSPTVMENDTAYVTTRRQALLKAAQERADRLLDRENVLAAKTLAFPERNRKPPPVIEPQLQTVFEGQQLKDLEQRNEEVIPDTSVISNVNEPDENDLTNIWDRDRQQVINDQQVDVTLSEERGIASQHPPEEGVSGYFIQKGLLLHRKACTMLHNGKLFIDRVVVPESYRGEILRVAHSIPLAGHMGIDKTRQRIEVHFYWPYLHADVKRYCETCPECQLVTRKRKAERAPLKPVPIVMEPFKKIAIDIVGELPRTKTGYRYILTIVDYATRYPEAIPLKSTHSREVADALIGVFSRFGIPEELVSDQGANLIGKLMTQLYELLGITKIKTSTYHPEANGLVERFNGTLKTMLRKFAGERILYWDKYIPYLLFAYREVPSQSTGFSPFELMYGRSVRGPLSIVKETWMENVSTEAGIVSHVLEIRRRLASMQQAVLENMGKSQAKQKALYDRHCSNRKLEVGDKVLVLLSTPGSKLETKWYGPYPITGVHDDGRSYELDTGRAHKQHRTYHINLLSKWQDRDEIAALAIHGSNIDIMPSEANLPKCTSTETWRDVIINPDLNEEKKKQLEKVLEDFSDVFSGIPDRTSAAVHTIDTGDASPTRLHPYKVPQAILDAYNTEIDKMLEMKIIRPSVSPWASPVVIVPKPDKTIRFCVDYRKLNAVSKMDAYPLPRIDAMLEKVAVANVISTIDLTKGYWQIPLEISSIEKTAFITHRGLFEFLVMPFGLKTAPATFQRMITGHVLKGLEEFADGYIDDIVVSTNMDFDRHVEQLRQVLQRLRTNKLHARPSKCKVGMTEVNFLGHRVGGNAIKPNTATIEAINRFPRPNTKKQVRSFLGLVGYYRKFISNFSEKAAVLTDLTRGSEPTKVKWSEHCEGAFTELKQAIQNPPVLCPPQWEKTFYLQVDASNRGLGAILCQKDNDSEEHPVAFASRKLMPREEKLSTTEKECLGIVWGVEVFRYYLYGRPFVLQTDHNPLVWFRRVKDKNTKLLRWSLTLQEFEMTIQHKKGCTHRNADALSRAF